MTFILCQPRRARQWVTITGRAKEAISSNSLSTSRCSPVEQIGSSSSRPLLKPYIMNIAPPRPLANPSAAEPCLPLPNAACCTSPPNSLKTMAITTACEIRQLSMTTRSHTSIHTMVKSNPAATSHSNLLSFCPLLHSTFTVRLINATFPF